MDCTGAPEVWERLARLVRRGGRSSLRLVRSGPHGDYDAAPHYDEIALLGSFHYTPKEARAALALLAEGGLDPMPLITHTGALSELPAFLHAHERGEGIRYAVTA